MYFNEISGIHFLSGVELVEGGGTNKVIFTVDGINYVAEEDPSDSYRSYMNEVVETDISPRYKFKPISVLVSQDDTDKDFDGFLFFDIANGKRILKIGTYYTDEFYPYCEFEWEPEKASVNIPKDKTTLGISTVGWGKFIGRKGE